MSVQEQAAQIVLSLSDQDATFILNFLNRIVQQNMTKTGAQQTRASLDFDSYGSPTERGKHVEQYMEEIRGNDRV